MGLLDSLKHIDNTCPFESAAESAKPAVPSISSWDHAAEDSQVWLDRYATFSSRPRFNPNMDGYISPYTGGHWGATSDIMQTLSAGAELGPAQEKIDPNRIFTAELAALKSLAADQVKIKKLFERRLLESLNDKGKFGLNEDDIEAMQALTSAASAIASINKEQIAVKKNIAELKIKQQQQNPGMNPTGPQTTTVSGSSGYVVGQSILNDIFRVTENAPNTPVVANYPDADLDQASRVLDTITADAALSESITYEAAKPTVYVEGDSIDNAKYVAYSDKTKEILDGYPLPTAKIVSFNPETNEATNELMESFPIKPANDIEE